VDDDGVVGTVSIGSVDSGAVAEAERQIRLILNPPTAEVGATYKGRVVNITKFGAFVNILPGRDGLVHISKMGGGKRIDKVEDVVSLGDEIEVKVDDVDPNGKVSLSPTSALGGGGGGGSSERGSASPARDEGNGSARETVSFEDSFDAEVREEFGDLGPAEQSGGGDRNSGGRRGGGRRSNRR
jgi:polyribonucleotide nucleotidyltransferase